ncbi:Pancreatic lipase-related protein 3 [Nymphon striatum]|nr:Pancreatic lipase-related protein 3 [Nymphon striatum]
MRRTLTGYSILISIQSYQLHSSFMDIWKITEKDGYWELLKHKDVNIIAVDWEKGCKAAVCPCMRQSQKEFHVSPEQIHVIGHSLGAHVSGEVGERIPGIGRITGLDPAMPFFHRVHKKLRIDPGDAKFVDIIHTDGRSSIINAIYRLCDKQDTKFFHVDLVLGWLNRVVIWISTQMEEGIRYFLGCNHIRSYQFFTESINTQCPFTSFHCGSWNDFTNGKCSDCGPDGRLCAHLGYHAKNSKRPKFSHNRYYLVTSRRQPFCLFQRKIVIKTENEGTSRSHDPQRGKININIRGKNGVSEFKRNLNLDSASNIVFMTGTYGVDPIRDFHLNWKHKVSLPKSQNMA